MRSDSKLLQFYIGDGIQWMKLLLLEYSRTETAEKLGDHRNTTRNQVNAMKEDLTKMLDDLFSMFG